LAERWRKPVKVLQVEHSSEAFITSDGRIQRGVNIVLDGESVERMRLGYVCAKCLEPFEVPWPLRCNVCGAPVASKQREFFEREFSPSVVELGPRTTMAEELERLREYREGFDAP
jgi:DNA-directed RNA polymerase subunit RPC12/RpoP